MGGDILSWDVASTSCDKIPSSAMSNCLLAPASLESRFFADDGLWREAPLLTGQDLFDPLPDVRNILVTGGEGFMYVSRGISNVKR